MTVTSRLGAGRPVVLARFPPIFGAVAAAAAILAAAAAAAPLFRSATGTASVRLALGPHAGEALVVSKDGFLAADVLRLRDRQLRAAVASSSEFGVPTESLVGPPLALRPFGSAGRRTTVRVATRTGFASHVHVTAGQPATGGLWVPGRLAAAADLEPGDVVTVSDGGRELNEPVAAIYEASATDPYWADVFATAGGTGRAAVLLADRPTFVRLATELQGYGQQGWVFALSPGVVAGMTLERAEALASDVSALVRAADDSQTQLGSVLSQPSVRSPLIEVVRAAEAAQRTIAPPVQTLSLTGQLAAMFGMIAAGFYAVRRRHIEMRSLDAKGITWIRLVLRCGAEGVLPVSMGASVGWFATWFLIRTFGPAGVFDADAVRASIVAVAMAAIAAVVVLSLVMTGAARRQAHEGARGVVASASAAGLLWEVPVLVLAAAALYEIWTRGAGAVSAGGSDVHVDRLLLLFPVLFIAGTAGLAVRALARLLLRVRGSESWPLALYLASRRLSTAPRVALLLVTASTLAIGVLAYAGTIVSTVRTAAEAKILLSSGADVTASTAGPISPPPPGFGVSTTNVMRLAFVQAGPNPARRVDVLGIEPHTLASTAHWEPSVSDRSLGELMRSLAPDSEPLPAIVVGPDLPQGERRLLLAGLDVPIRSVGTVRAFPGATPRRTIVVSTSALRSVLERHGAATALDAARYEAWAAGPTGPARAFLIASGADPGSVRVTTARLRAPGFRALAWSFVFMEMVGLVTAAIALIGLLLYLQARQRSRDLSYALARRMGLTAGTHRLAILSEVAGLLMSAYVMGSALGITTSVLIYRRLDPFPSLRPGLALITPRGLFLASGVAIVACASVGAWLVHRRADRADVGAVLRFAE